MAYNFKTEKEFQTRMIKDLKKNNPKAWIYKIPDVNMQIKPFDIICCLNGEATGIELKICNLKKWVTYEQMYNMLRPNQIGALDILQKAWWASFISVYNKADDHIYTSTFKFLEWDNQIEL